MGSGFRLIFGVSCAAVLTLGTGCSKQHKKSSKISESLSFAVLSTEASHPFANGDKKFISGHEKAISQFPNVTDCLIEEESQKEIPDLRLIDWDKISSPVRADVCMWRVFNSYDDLEKVYNWFEFHEARASIPRQSLNTLPTTDINVRPLYFYWKSSEGKSPMSKLESKPLFAHSIGVSVPVSFKNNKIINVHTNWSQTF